MTRFAHNPLWLSILLFGALILASLLPAAASADEDDVRSDPRFDGYNLSSAADIACASVGKPIYQSCLLSRANAGAELTEGLIGECIETSRKAPAFQDCLKESIGDRQGCYCNVAKSGEDVSNSSPEFMSVPIFNSPETCGDKSLDGKDYFNCEWFKPAAVVPGNTETKLFSNNDSGALNLKGAINSLNQTGRVTPQQLIGRAIKTAMGVIGTIALVVMVYAGILYMVATGNANREKEALEILYWGILGIIVSLGSYAIVSFIIDNAFVV